MKLHRQLTPLLLPLILPSHRLNDRMCFLDIILVPGLQTISLHKAGPVAIRLDDLIFGGRERGGCSSMSVESNAVHETMPKMERQVLRLTKTIGSRHLESA